MSQKQDKQRIYNSPEWARLRAIKLQEEPLCQRCLDLGFVKPARVIHHIEPIEKARSYEEMRRLALCGTQGLLSLCFQCHSDIHREMASRTKEGHKRAAATALERWAESHKPSGESFTSEEPLLQNPLDLNAIDRL